MGGTCSSGPLSDATGAFAVSDASRAVPVLESPYYPGQSSSEHGDNSEVVGAWNDFKAVVSYDETPTADMGELPMKFHASGDETGSTWNEDSSMSEEDSYSTDSGPPSGLHGGLSGRCKLCMAEETLPVLVSACACENPKYVFHYKCMLRWVLHERRDLYEVCPDCRFPFGMPVDIARACRGHGRKSPSNRKKRASSEGYIPPGRQADSLHADGERKRASSSQSDGPFAARAQTYSAPACDARSPSGPSRAKLHL